MLEQMTRSWVRRKGRSASTDDAFGDLRRIGRLGPAAYLDGFLMHHVLVRLGVALAISDVLTQRIEEGIDELAADLGFVVQPALIAIQLAQTRDEVKDGCRSWHWRTSLDRMGPHR